MPSTCRIFSRIKSYLETHSANSSIKCTINIVENNGKKIALHCIALHYRIHATVSCRNCLIVSTRIVQQSMLIDEVLVRFLRDLKLISFFSFCFQDTEAKKAMRIHNGK